MATDELLFSEVKKDIEKHLGTGKLYEVVVSDYTDDPEDGKLHFILEDDSEWFQVNSYDSYWTNTPHFFDMPQKGESKIVDVIRDIFGEDAAIMALWDRGSYSRSVEGKHVFDEEDGEFITDSDVTYFVVKKNKKKLHLEPTMDNVEITEHNY
jgi:hypothetical protein